MNKDFLWVEKYRPNKLKDCIMIPQLRSQLVDFVKAGELPNFIFHGSSGLGKTTIARALCEEMDIDYLLINGSEESGIDTLRTKIMGYAATLSMDGGRKMIIVDEADYLNATSTMPAFRGVIEEFSKNCGFIFTANHISRIIPALQSRCIPVHFKFDRKIRKTIAKAFMDRLIYILDSENIKYDKPVLVDFIMKHFPDFRRIIGEIQMYSSSGCIDSGVMQSVTETSIKNLIKSLKEKNFKGCREWVVNNNDTEPTSMFRSLYDGAYEYLDKSSIPDFIMLMAQYQYQSAFVADQEINTMAFVLEVMAQCEFK